jgi:hypothetical protein
MATMRRKTLVVCTPCHQAIHGGQPAAVTTAWPLQSHMPGNWPAWFGPGPLEKDPPSSGHLASGLPVCKLRGKSMALKPGRSRRYQIPDDAACIIVGLLTVRDHVTAPILTGVRRPRMGRKPATWTAIDRDDENLRQQANPLRRPWHRNSPIRRMDNFSIRDPQAPRCYLFLDIRRFLDNTATLCNHPCAKCTWSFIGT